MDLTTLRYWKVFRPAASSGRATFECRTRRRVKRPLEKALGERSLTHDRKLHITPVWTAYLPVYALPRESRPPSGNKFGNASPRPSESPYRRRCAHPAATIAAEYVRAYRYSRSRSSSRTEFSILSRRAPCHPGCRSRIRLSSPSIPFVHGSSCGSPDYLRNGGLPNARRSGRHDCLAPPGWRDKGFDYRRRQKPRGRTGASAWIIWKRCGRRVAGPGLEHCGLLACVRADGTSARAPKGPGLQGASFGTRATVVPAKGRLIDPRSGREHVKH